MRTTRCTGRGAPRKIWRVIDRLRFGLRDRLEEKVIVVEDGRRYSFVCTNRLEVLRAATLLVKEEGTIAWLRGGARPGDVVYDVGANIGLYSIFAANLLGAEGAVYAFEPHAVNFTHLCRNIAENGLGGRVVPLSVALSDADGFSDFNYLDWSAGSSFSQLGEVSEAFETAFAELKYGVTVDTLIGANAVPPPNLVKIDVDGIEAKVLRGMKGLLAGNRRPRSVQVELQKHDDGAIADFMDSVGYAPVERHYSMFGQMKLARGVDPAAIAHNVVFAPRAAGGR